jgi:hypothetical protein
MHYHAHAYSKNGKPTITRSCTRRTRWPTWRSTSPV